MKSRIAAQADWSESREGWINHLGDKIWMEGYMDDFTQAFDLADKIWHRKIEDVDFDTAKLVSHILVSLFAKNIFWLNIDRLAARVVDS